MVLIKICQPVTFTVSWFGKRPLPDEKKGKLPLTEEILSNYGP
jgi:hypothetical protein